MYSVFREHAVRKALHFDTVPAVCSLLCGSVSWTLSYRARVKESKQLKWRSLSAVVGCRRADHIKK